MSKSSEEHSILRFEKWYSRIKWAKEKYHKSELKSLLHMCWNASNPPKKETRSDRQNRYMWGVVYTVIGNDLGYEIEEVHQIFGEKFLSYEKNGRVFIKSTASLSVKGMEEYLEKVRMYASTDLSIIVPLPNEHL